MQLSRALRWSHKDVVALVGAGGKTSTMFLLARELAARGQHVVATTTTQMAVNQMSGASGCIVSEDPETVMRELPEQLARCGHVLVLRETDDLAGKAKGINSELVKRMADLPDVDTVIVEADGARGLPLKAPAAYEPVVPSCTTLLVPMAGLSVVGHPLDAWHTHRPELVVALTGGEPGAPVTPSILATVLAHPEGGRRYAPPGARVAPFLNQADSDERLRWGRASAQQMLLEPAVDEVVIGAAEGAEPAQEVWGRTVAIVLAAGGATRFGQPKLLLPWRDTTILGAVVDRALAAEGVDEVLIVVGSEATLALAALDRRPVRTVVNEAWATGQSSSVCAGLRALSDGVHAALFLLGDQPEVEPSVIAGLIRLHRSTLAPVVVPSYNGQRGNPVLFDRAAFPELLELTGDVGGRAIFESHAGSMESLAVQTPPPFDVDTPEDYARAQSS